MSTVTYLRHIAAWWLNGYSHGLSKPDLGTPRTALEQDGLHKLHNGMMFSTLTDLHAGVGKCFNKCK